MLMVMDLALLVAEFVGENTDRIMPSQPKSEGFYEEVKDRMRAAGATHQRHLPNILRKLVLRFQPYLTPTTKPLQICTKTLLIFTSLAPFLQTKEILRDPLHDAFSTADDPDNVRIPCALSLLAYELYPNLLSILKHQASSP